MTFTDNPLDFPSDLDISYAAPVPVSDRPLAPLSAPGDIPESWLSPFVVVVPLKYSTVSVFVGPRIVRTTFHAYGLHCDAFRDLSDPVNVAEARSQGYIRPLPTQPIDPSLAIFRSLVEHEILHSFLSEHLFDRPSCVLSLQAGVTGPDGTHVAPLWERYEEEALCLSFQYYLNTGNMPRPLQQIHQITRYWNSDVLRCLSVWKRDIAPILSPLWQDS